MAQWQNYTFACKTYYPVLINYKFNLSISNFNKIKNAINSVNFLITFNHFQAFQLYNACTLYTLSKDDKCVEWQVIIFHVFKFFKMIFKFVMQKALFSFFSGKGNLMNVLLILLKMCNKLRVKNMHNELKCLIIHTQRNNLYMILK